MDEQQKSQEQRDAETVDAMRELIKEINANAYTSGEPYWLSINDYFFGKFTDAALRTIDRLRDHITRIAEACEIEAAGKNSRGKAQDLGWEIAMEHVGKHLRAALNEIDSQS